VATVIATGVNAEGQREILGLDVFTTEDGAGWTAFLRGLMARGAQRSGPGHLRRPRRAQEPHRGDAPGVRRGSGAGPYAMRNLLARVPMAAQALVATLLRTIFAQSNATQVQAQFGRVVDQLETQFPTATGFLVEAQTDLPTFASFPVEHWRQIRSNKSQQQLNKEPRQRTDVAGIFPNPPGPHSSLRHRRRRAT
jgi:putative transposase